MVQYNATKIALFITLTALIIPSARSLYYTKKYSDLLSVGQLIAKDTFISADMAADVRDDIERLTDQKLCQSDLIAAGLRVTLKDLDFQNSVIDNDSWSQQLEAADHFMTQALSCQPTNGDLWVRLAMVRWSIVEIPQEQSMLMRLSVGYSPAEPNPIRARLVQWGRLSEVSLDQTRPELISDIQTMLLKFPISEIAVVIKYISPQLKRMVDDEAAILPESRRKQIATAGAL